MRKFARIAWVEGRALRCYGCRLGIRANAAGLIEALLGALPPEFEWLPSHSRVQTLFSLVTHADGRCSLYAGGRLLHRSASLDLLAYELERYIDLYLALTARNRSFVHAGVVAFDDVAVILPGRSGSGKTTLVQALLARGATYYSDDCAVIDGRGRVHPYARPLAIRSGAAARVNAHPDARTVGRTPLPLGLVLFTRYHHSARFEPTALRPAPGVLELFKHSLSARSNPEQSMTALSHVARQAQLYGGTRGEADEAADRIRSMVALRG